MPVARSPEKNSEHLEPKGTQETLVLKPACAEQSSMLP